jgi:GntR family transcriptional regulator
MNSATEPELILQGGAPIHRQIRDQIRASILSGQLHPGEELPTLRALAVGLSVNPNTIARVYAWLERKGLVTTEDGSGTFVALPQPSARRSGPPGRTGGGSGPARRSGPTDGEPRSRLRQLCSRFLALAARRGFTADEVIDTLMALPHGRSHS